MTANAHENTPAASSDEELARQGRDRAVPSNLDVPRVDPMAALLDATSPEVRAKARAALERANVVELHPEGAPSCTCPRRGEPGFSPRTTGSCLSCQRAREELRTEVTAQQREFRRAAWQRCLTGNYLEYAAADVAELTPEQDPDYRVSGWLDSASLTLVLVGDNSVGKSHAAFAVGNQAANRDEPWWVVAWNLPDLNEQLRPGGPVRVYEYAERCDLLILDDLGAEKISDWTLQELYRLLEARVRNRRRTIITTNLPYDERGFADTPPEKRPVTPNMLARYGGRVTHRIIQRATLVRVRGESWRKPVPW